LFVNLLGQIDFHGLVNTHIQAGEADHALLGIVGDLPALSIHVKSACGADGHAGRTACAAFLQVLDLLGQGFNAHSQLLQVIEGESHLTLLTAQLHHHSALFSGINAGSKDVDHEVIVLDETVVIGSSTLLGGNERTILAFFIEDPPLHPGVAPRAETRENPRSGSGI